MNTLLFKYAVEIEKSGSITKAAQNLYMAQPNLSKAIKDLEAELGYEISGEHQVESRSRKRVANSYTMHRRC